MKTLRRGESIRLYRTGEFIRRHRLLAASLILPLIWGFQPSDPVSPLVNQAPDTRIVVAPVAGDSSDHYVSPVVIFNVQWFGNDPDGQVAGYYLQVDGGSWIWTTKTDSAMAFESSTPDPNHPGKTLPSPHTITVKAKDDEGLEDATPAQRSFSATNYIPFIREFVADFQDDATVGQGISFSINWGDSNSSGAYFRLWIDGAPVTDWDSRSAFQFCKTSDPAILNTVDSGAVKPVDISLLRAGGRTLMVKVKDWGGAISDSVTRSITIDTTKNPTITAVAPTYEGAAYYPDGSVFYEDGATTHFEVTATAVDYFGGVQAFRNRLMPVGGNAEWSSWGAGSYDVLNLPSGAYRFETVCRDWSGRESAVTGYEFEIYRPNFRDDGATRVLIVDETRDGNGGRGSPDDNQSDSLWRSIFDYDTTNRVTPNGWLITELDYTNRVAGPNKYISAKDVFDKDLIIWHADDNANLDLKAGAYNLRLLSEYLDAGGRLFLCGWDVISNFNSSDVDSVTFSSNAGFGQRYLRISGGKRSSERVFSSALGSAGYGDLRIDPAKVPNSWSGTLDRCWVLFPAHRTEAIAVWGPEHAFSGLGVAMKNFSPLNPWRTIICGFPIYFLRIDDSKPFVVKAATELLAP